MTILRLSDQKVTEPYPGVSQRNPAGEQTGSTQLRVYDAVSHPGAEIPYHAHVNTEATYIFYEVDVASVVAYLLVFFLSASPL